MEPDWPATCVPVGADKVVFSVGVWLKSLLSSKLIAMALDDEVNAVTVGRWAPAHVWSTLVKAESPLALL